MSSLLTRIGIGIARRSWRVYNNVSLVGRVAIADSEFNIPVRSAKGLELLSFTDKETRFVGLLRSVLSDRRGAVVDVGMNVGRFLLCARAADTDRTYVGFDPHVTCVAYVDQLVRANNFGSVSIFPIGLTDGMRIATFQSGGDTDVSATTVEAFYSSDRFQQRKQVLLESGDSIIDGLGGQQIALLKVDVEGGELEVLTGFGRTIRRDHPALILEVAPYAHSEAAVAEFRKGRIASLESALRDFGYTRFARIVNGSDLESVATLDPGKSTDIHEMDYLCLP